MSETLRLAPKYIERKLFASALYSC